MHYFCSILTLEEVEVSENQVIYLQMIVFQERKKINKARACKCLSRIALVGVVYFGVFVTAAHSSVENS